MSKLRLALGICGVWVGLVAAGQGGEWPAGRSPEAIGRLVAENFLGRENMLMPPDQVIHYAQVCTWQGGSDFCGAERGPAAADPIGRALPRPDGAG